MEQEFLGLRILFWTFLLSLLFVVGTEVFFSLRYTEDFARSELSDRGFEDIEILEERLMSVGVMSPLAQEKVWVFRASREESPEEGELTCLRTWTTGGEERCRIIDASTLQHP